MSIQIPNEHRRIIPRWRYSKIALTTGELVFSLSPKPTQEKESSEFLNKLHLWGSNHTIEYAADLVSAGLSQGRLTDSVDAAKYLLSKSSDVTPTVLSIAEEILVRAGKKPPAGLNDTFNGEVPKIYAKIHNLRKSLIEFPRNPLMWVDLSRSYILLGQMDRAKEAMIFALNMAPTNRFVIRSAARLYVHLDEPDRAHHLLWQQAINRRDPWLLAAEIAVANVADIAPKSIKTSKDVLDRNIYLPFHTAELASALASLELFNGAYRKARKLFEFSLISPNENSVAQSTWAKQWLPTLELGSAITSIPRTFEAQAWSAYLELNWRGIVAATSDWLLDEPFSSRSAEMGSFAASVGLDDYMLAETIALSGLVANPTDHGLINNYAFILANQNKLVEAMNILRRASRPAPNTASEVALKATEGMIKLRSGIFDEGQNYYQEAIALAARASLNRVASLASVFYAREMNYAGLLHKDESLQLIDLAISKTPTPDIKWIADKTMKQISSDQQI